MALAAFICFPVNQANSAIDTSQLNLTAIATEDDPFFQSWAGMSVFRVRNTETVSNNQNLNASINFNGNATTQNITAFNGPNWNYVVPYVPGNFGDTFVAFSAFPGTAIVTFYDLTGNPLTSFTKAAGQPFVYTGATSVPEPGTLLLLGSGLLGLVVAGRKKIRK